MPQALLVVLTSRTYLPDNIMATSYLCMPNRLCQTVSSPLGLLVFKVLLSVSTLHYYTGFRKIYFYKHLASLCQYRNLMS